MVAVIDFETTGLSPAQGDRATEVAAVIVDDGRVVDRYQSLMNAGVRIPAYIEALTGISNAMIRKAPPAGQANLPPSAGLQFFGQVDIDHQSKKLTVSLKDRMGGTVFSQELEPGVCW